MGGIHSKPLKWFALVGGILFIGMALAPSVNAGVIKDSIKKRVNEGRNKMLNTFSSNYNNVKSFQEKTLWPPNGLLLLLQFLAQLFFGILEIILLPLQIIIDILKDSELSLIEKIRTILWIPILALINICLILVLIILNRGNQCNFAE